MSYATVRVEGVPELILTLENLDDAIENPVEGLLSAINETIVPELLAKSMSTWNVRTGTYAASWYVMRLSETAAEIGNDARNPQGYPYAAPLEWGWTTRAGWFKESPGVLFPVVEEGADRLVEAMDRWIASKADL